MSTIEELQQEIITVQLGIQGETGAITQELVDLRDETKEVMASAVAAAENAFVSETNSAASLANALVSATSAASSANTANLSAQATHDIARTTRALLYADLAHTADVTALVTNDATAYYNGIYIKLGASGTGSWQKSAYVPPVIDGSVTNTKIGERIIPSNLMLNKDSFVENFTNQDDFDAKKDTVNFSTVNGLQVAVVDSVTPKEIVKYVGNIIGKEIRLAYSTTTLVTQILIGFSDTPTYNTAQNLGIWHYKATTTTNIKLRQSNGSVSTLVSSTSNAYYNDNMLYMKLRILESNAVLEMYSDSTYTTLVNSTTISGLTNLAKLRYLYIRTTDGSASGIKLSKLEFSPTTKTDIESINVAMNAMNKPLDLSPFTVTNNTNQFTMDIEKNIVAVNTTTSLIYFETPTMIFKNQVRLSDKINVDTTKTFGAMIGFNTSDPTSAHRLLVGYEPAHSAIELYANSVFYKLIDAPTSGNYEIAIEKLSNGKVFIIINGQPFNLADYISNYVFTQDRVRLQLKTTDLGLSVKNLVLSSAPTETNVLSSETSTGLSVRGNTTGANVHIYQFGGRGNDWCWVRTPSNYDPTGAPHPFVICNHGNGWTMDGSASKANWSEKTQYGVDTQNSSAYLDTSATYYKQYSNETIERFLEAGYIVCGAENYADGLYGNNDCRQACADFFFHVIRSFNVEQKCYMIGASNGAMTTLNAVRMLGGIARVKGIILQYPLTNLRYSYENDHPSGVATAYGISTGDTAAFLAATKTHDPMIVDTIDGQKIFPLPPVLIYYSTQDTVTPSVGHAEQFIALLEASNSCYVESVCVNPGGEAYQHGDWHHFDPVAYLAFCDKWR